ncbi:MAG: T9SS type A sorting domain-containing protein [Bacteroidetes bacterium]|nr:T9SS type A sorting domain-containing protein [Bacteroidota bacterium]
MIFVILTGYKKEIMRTNITFLLFALFTAYSYAQQPSWQWAKQAGSAGDNDGHPFNPTGNEKIADIKTDSLGNVYAVGYLYTNPVFQNAALTSTTPPNTGGYGRLDAYLIKYSSCGKTLWWRRMGGTANDAATSLALDNNGNVIVLGGSASGTYTVGDGTHDTIINSGNQVFLAKFDTAGNFINVLNTYTGFPNLFSANVIPIKLFFDSQGNYFISDGMQAARINTLGVLTNFYNYTATSGNVPKIRGIVLDKNDNVYVSGFFTGTVNIGGTSVSYTNVSSGNSNSIIFKFSPAGSLLWYNTSNPSGVGGDILGKCTMDTSTTVLITGGVAAMGTATVFGYAVNSPVPIQSANANVFYHFSASTGSLISASAATMQYVDYITPAYTSKDDTIYCTGTLGGYLAFNTATYTSGSLRQNCIGKFDATGNFINVNPLPQTGSSPASVRDEITSMDMDKQGNIYICGMFGGTLDSAGTAVHIYGGTEDGFVAKYGYSCGNTPTTGTVPNAPLALTATNNGSLTNNVNWQDNSNDEGNFELHYTFGGNPTYSLLATLPANTTSYAHTGLSYTTTYCYKVAATNSIGTSAFSNTDCATTPAAPTATSIPNTPLNLTATNNGSLTNNVAWNDNSNDETNFELHYTFGSSTTYSLLATLPPNTTSYAHTGLSYTTTYCYKVAATNSVGTSAFSNTACATTPAAPDSTIGIVKLKDESLKLRVYPNPANTEIYFDVPSNEKQITIELYNMLGSLVVSKKNYSNRSAISISTLSKGVYYYKVILPKGEFAGKVILD